MLKQSSAPTQFAERGAPILWPTLLLFTRNPSPLAITCEGPLAVSSLRSLDFYYIHTTGGVYKSTYIAIISTCEYKRDYMTIVDV